MIAAHPSLAYDDEDDLLRDGIVMGLPGVARPVGPGEVLQRNFLGQGLTQERLAEALRVSRLSVNQIVRGRRAVTAEMALRLAKVTDTTPEFWLSLQMAVDLHDAEVTIGSVVRDLPVVRRPPTPLVVDDGVF